MTTAKEQARQRRIRAALRALKALERRIVAMLSEPDKDEDKGQDNGNRDRS